MVEITHENPTKLDEYTLQTERTVKKVPVAYTLNYLVAQKEAILKDMANYQAARQIELDEVNALIAECNKLGIVAKEEVGVVSFL